MKELTINWHITEACNFKCGYCFAKWEKPCKKELLHCQDKVNLLLDEIMKLTSYFDQFTQIRLNLVGGETFLYKEQVFYIMEQAKLRQMRLSAITNGSQFDVEMNAIIANYLDSLGISMDSVNRITNLQIGRQMKNTAINSQLLIENIQMIKKLNPQINLKVNTVVNKFNHKEYLGDFIDQVNPDKWKIFKVLPIMKESESFIINDEEFQGFIERHQAYQKIIFSENNDEMTHSYLMIDPLGRFFQNQTEQLGYQYSQPIIENGIESAISQIQFDIIKFSSRYQQ